MKPLAECRLYAFVDTHYFHGRAPEALARQLCDGGADLIQLRAKESPPEEVRRMAQAILSITRRAGVGLVINDHPGIASELGAELCHLGQEDFFGAGRTRVEQVLPGGRSVAVGLSTHSPEQAIKAMLAGAAYLGVGPVYATGTKPGVQPVTLEYVRWAKAHVTIPWFAIGGISLTNVEEVLTAGARRICVVSAILDAEDVAAACRAFRAKLERQ
jgi:thiamine-phosphate pyrophosphorylase